MLMIFGLKIKFSSQINQMKKLNLAFSFHAFAHVNDQISDAKSIGQREYIIFRTF